MKKILLIILCFAVLVGCSTSSSSPKEIRKEIWDNASLVLDAIETSMENDEAIGEYEHQIYISTYQKYIDENATDLTKEEFELLKELSNMVRSHLAYIYYDENELEKKMKVSENYDLSKGKVSDILRK